MRPTDTNKGQWQNNRDTTKSAQRRTSMDTGLAITLAGELAPNRAKSRRLTPHPDLRRLFQQPNHENFAVTHLHLGLLAAEKALQTSDAETALGGHVDLLFEAQ